MEILFNKCHIDRHSGPKCMVARDGENLVDLLGIVDLKVSRRDISVSRTLLYSRLNLSVERFDTEFRRESEDSTQRIFDSDWVLEEGEAGVDTTSTGSYFKHDGIYLLRRCAEVHISARA